MIIVSDTSAISNLIAIDKISLLQQLYKQVIIPEAVFKKLSRRPLAPDEKDFRTYDWIQVKSL